MARFRYVFLAVFLAVMFLVVDTEPARAIGYPREAVITKVVRKPANNGVPLVHDDAPVTVKPFAGVMSVSEKPKMDIVTILLRTSFSPTQQFNFLPPEDKDPIAFVNPPKIWKWQMGRIASWLPTIETVLERNDFPHASPMLILGIIAQETQGDPNAECNGFDSARGTCAVGVMGIMPGTCGLTAAQLKDPYKNIECGSRVINQVIEQAIEKGYRPGHDAIRAALAAYNCSWESFEANRCFDFGGLTYADKINWYWLIHLTNYLNEYPLGE